MTDSIVYNIPATLVRAYRGRSLIVRAHNPSEIQASLANIDMDSVSYVQVLSLNRDHEPMMRWGHSIGVDLVARDPRRDLPLLYAYAALLARRPVRVTVSVVQGFGKVVKLAASLGFAVKLEGSQPGPALVEELSRVAHAYLSQEMVSEPIEYFHSLLMAFYHGDPVNLWALQEEDPTRNRFITEAGEEALSPRFAPVHAPHDVASFVSAFRESVLADQGECCRCDFVQQCRGYFKWPRKDYRCDGVKSVLQTLKNAADQLKDDLASYQALEERERS